MEKTGTKGLSLKQKAQNYWYHYKWHTLAALFALFVGIFIVCSQVSAPEPDVLLYYGGPAYFSEDAVQSVEGAFATVMDKDCNGDGKKSTQLIVTTVLSGDQVATKVMDAREEGELLYMGDLSAAEAEYQQEILYGLGIVCLIDQAHFEESSERFALLSDLLPTQDLPEKTVGGGRGVLLFDTAFGRYFEVFAGLPKDTVLCIKKQPLHIKDKDYKAATQLLTSVLLFDLERRNK
ncbi:MAG: hypothetical protein E7599_06880 [Ruminococcaceae bacterium]|nr:hypothetical protein [Oscillospiraceae bacterium]